MIAINDGMSRQGIASLTIAIVMSCRVTAPRSLTTLPEMTVT